MTERQLQQLARQLVDEFGADSIGRQDSDGKWSVAKDLLLLAYPVQASRLNRSHEQLDERRNWLLNNFTLEDMEGLKKQVSRLDSLCIDYPGDESHQPGLFHQRESHTQTVLEASVNSSMRNEETAVNRLVALLEQRFVYDSDQPGTVSSVYQDVMLLRHHYFQAQDRIIDRIVARFPGRLKQLAELPANYLNRLYRTFEEDPGLDPNRLVMLGKTEETFFLFTPDCHEREADQSSKEAYAQQRNEEIFNPSSNKAIASIFKNNEQSVHVIGPIDLGKYSQHQLDNLICQRGDKTMVLSEDVQRALKGVEQFRPSRRSCEEYSILYNCDADLLQSDDDYRRDFYFKHWRFILLPP